MNCVWNPFNSVLVTQQQFYTHEQLGIYIWYIFFFLWGGGGGGEMSMHVFPHFTPLGISLRPLPLEIFKNGTIHVHVCSWVKICISCRVWVVTAFLFLFFFYGLNHFTVVGPNQSSDEEENSSSDDDEINDKVHSCIYM